MKDGELHDHVRWCASCDHDHGPLYACSNYPQSVLDEIEKGKAEMWSQLTDPGWCAEQIRNGLPPEAIPIFKFFAGIPPTLTKN